VIFHWRNFQNATDSSAWRALLSWEERENFVDFAGRRVQLQWGDARDDITGKGKRNRKYTAHPFFERETQIFNIEILIISAIVFFLGFP
jgi:hypothetical protein